MKIDFNISIQILTVILCLQGCSHEANHGFEYRHRVTTGGGHSIMRNGQQMEIAFSEHSVPLARWSLCHLRPEIADSSKNRILVFGVIEEAAQSLLMPRTGNAGGARFRISGWKLKSPFVFNSLDEIDITNGPKKTVRTNLRRDDFTHSDVFDPQFRGFDPMLYLEGNR